MNDLPMIYTLLKAKCPQSNLEYRISLSALSINRLQNTY